LRVTVELSQMNKPPAAAGPVARPICLRTRRNGPFRPEEFDLLPVPLSVTYSTVLSALAAGRC
jgi:hypothetical protein